MYISIKKISWLIMLIFFSCYQRVALNEIKNKYLWFIDGRRCYFPLIEHLTSNVDYIYITPAIRK